MKLFTLKKPLGGIMTKISCLVGGMSSGIASSLVICNQAITQKGLESADIYTLATNHYLMSIVVIGTVSGSVGALLGKTAWDFIKSRSSNRGVT